MWLGEAAMVSRLFPGFPGAFCESLGKSAFHPFYGESWNRNCLKSPDHRCTSCLSGHTIRHQRMYMCNLVDPASSYMLVSRIKPCMSQYKYLTANL